MPLVRPLKTVQIINPMRVITSTVRIEGALHRRCPVKTSSPIPKEKMFDVIKALNGIILKSPVNVGDIVIKNVLTREIAIILEIKSVGKDETLDGMCDTALKQIEKKQ